MLMTFSLFKVNKNWVIDNNQYFDIDFSQCKSIIENYANDSKWVSITLSTHEPKFYREKFEIIKHYKYDNVDFQMKGCYIDLCNKENDTNDYFAYLTIKNSKLSKYLKNINNLYLIKVDVAHQNHVQ